MSALIAMHLPEKENTQTTIPVSELRIKDVITKGIGIDEPVTVNKIFNPQESVDVRVLTLVTSRNGIYYREYSAEMEVVIKN